MTADVRHSPNHHGHAAFSYAADSSASRSPGFGDETLWHTAHSNPLAELPTREVNSMSTSVLEPRAALLRHPLDTDSIAEARTVPIDRAARVTAAARASACAASSPSTAHLAQGAHGQHVMPQQLVSAHLRVPHALHAIAADTEEAAAKAAEAAAVFDAFSRRRLPRSPAVSNSSTYNGTHVSTNSSLQTLRISPLHSPATSSSEQVSATLALRTRDARPPSALRQSSGGLCVVSRVPRGHQPGSPQPHMAAHPLSELSSCTEVPSEVSTLDDDDGAVRPSGPAGEGLHGSGGEEDEEGCMDAGRASTCASVQWPSQSGSQYGGCGDDDTQETVAVSSQPGTLAAASATLPLSTLSGGPAAAGPPLPSPTGVLRGNVTERQSPQRRRPPLLPRPASAPAPSPGTAAAKGAAALPEAIPAPKAIRVDPGSRHSCTRIGDFAVSSWVRSSQPCPFPAVASAALRTSPGPCVSSKTRPHLPERLQSSRDNPRTDNLTHAWAPTPPATTGRTLGGDRHRHTPPRHHHGCV